MTAITVQDLDNAQVDAITLAEVANSRSGGVAGGPPIIETVTRLGDTINTVQGQLASLGFVIPAIDWMATTSVTSNIQVYRYPPVSGDFYVAKVPVPFVTGGIFTPSNWQPLASASSISPVDNIVALRAITITPPDNQLRTILGHTFVGDGGGGDFYWSSASTETDNNGTVIKVYLLAIGRWIRDFSGPHNVKWYGAVGDGITDNHPMIQPIVNETNAIYFPNADGEVYGFGSTLQVLVHTGLTMRADNGNRDVNHLFKALSPMDSVLQFLDGTPTDPVVSRLNLENIGINGDSKAVIGVAFGKTGSTVNQLVKFVQTSNLSIKLCRIGYQIGAAGVGIETDSAGYANHNTLIEQCTDIGVYIDTGNGAAITFTGSAIQNNGASPTLDSFNPSETGANISVIGGEINLFGCTTAGSGAQTPATCDISVNSADVRLNAHWSDTHGRCILENGGVDSSIYIAGLRHFEGNMDAGNTPVSIEHVCKMTLIGCYLFGVIESNEGVGGGITAIGMNYVSGGAASNNAGAYTGTLKTNSKGVVSINNLGGRAQIIVGGGARDMEAVGHFQPQYLGIGAESGGSVPVCVNQYLGPAIGASGYTTYLDEGTGSQIVYVNCVRSDISGNVIPLNIAKDSHIVTIGGGSFDAFNIRRNKFASMTPVAESTFQEIFTILQGGDDSTLGQSVIIPPKLSADPTYSSGDYWEGGIYYNTTDNEHRVNVGGTTWFSINGAVGTFIVTMNASTSGTITLQTSSETLAYVKNGRQVTITGYLVVDSVSSPVGNLTIDGLPFTSGDFSDFSERSVCSMAWQNLAIAATGEIHGFIESGQTAITVRDGFGGTGGADATFANHMAATSRVYINLVYFTDD